jgi:hypothetical protein
MIFNNVIFGLSDILIKNHSAKKINYKYLSELVTFSKNNNISLYLVTGLKDEIGLKIIKKHKLDTFFKLENIFHVTDVYFQSLSDIDREIRSEKYKQDKNYLDDYFKIYFLTKIKPKLNTKKTLYVGHDLWSDAYYITEYTKVNVLLLKQFISFNNELYETDLKTINVINPSFSDFKEVLTKKRVFDYTKLKSFAKNYLLTKTIGKINLNLDYSKLYKKKV